MRKYILATLACFLLIPGIKSASHAHKCPQSLNVDELLKAMDAAQPILSDKFASPKLPAKMMKYTYHGVDYYDYAVIWKFLKTNLSEIKNLGFDHLILDHATSSGFFEFFSTNTLCVYRTPKQISQRVSFEMLYLH